MKAIILTLAACLLPLMGNAQGQEQMQGMQRQMGPQQGGQGQGAPDRKKVERYKEKLGILVSEGIEPKQAQEVLHKLIDLKVENPAATLADALKAVGVDEDKATKALQKFHVMKREKGKQAAGQAMQELMQQQGQQGGPQGGPQQQGRPQMPGQGQQGP